jgi:hypothetical protein
MLPVSDETLAALAKGKKLDKALLAAHQLGDVEEFLPLMAKEWKLAPSMLAPGLVEYARQTLRVGRIPGPFRLEGLLPSFLRRGTWGEVLGIDFVAKRPFPALQVGDDGTGVELWLLGKQIFAGERNGYLLATSRVGRHALAAEVQRRGSYSSPQWDNATPEFLEQLMARAGQDFARPDALDIIELIEVQAALHALGFDGERAPDVRGTAPPSVLEETLVRHPGPLSAFLRRFVQRHFGASP